MAAPILTNLNTDITLCRYNFEHFQLHVYLCVTVFSVYSYGVDQSKNVLDWMLKMCSVYGRSQWADSEHKFDEAIQACPVNSIS
jgi:ferredoxin